MARHLNVHLLPSLIAPEQLAGHTAVAIDILRASTTLVHAIAALADEIIPAVSIEEAWKQAELLRAKGVEFALGGERGGVMVPNFDLGNSPFEYTQERVGGKTLVFTSTNGTQAIQRCALAEQVFIGAFVNFSALYQRLHKSPHIHLVCAGTNEEITREDVLFAGALVDAFAEREEDLHMNDQANIAADAWRTAVGDMPDTDSLLAALRNSYGGRNMLRLGQSRDIERAASLDLFDLVPEWNPKSGSITA